MTVIRPGAIATVPPGRPFLEAVARAVLERVGRSPKPFTICFLGASGLQLPRNAQAAMTLEGAAIFWMGCRQKSMLARAFAISLQIGAAADSIVVELEPGAITVSARRPLPLKSDDCHPARVHALEIPYGRFARRIGLPMQTLTLTSRKLQDGCLKLTFSKKEST